MTDELRRGQIGGACGRIASREAKSSAAVDSYESANSKRLRPFNNPAGVI